MNEGVIFAKRVSGKNWFNFGIDANQIAQNYFNPGYASRLDARGRPINETVLQTLSYLLSSPLIIFNKISHSEEKIPRRSRKFFRAFRSSRNRRSSGFNNNFNFSNTLMTGIQAMRKFLTGNKPGRILSPRFLSLFEFQTNVTNFGSPDVAGVFESQMRGSLLNNIRSLVYSQFKN